MPEIRCPRTGCDYKTEDVPAETALALIQIHATEHDTPTAPKAQPQAEKLKRPTIEAGVTLEKWVYFTSRWNRYKKLSEIPEDTLTAQLLECADEELMMDLHRNNGAALDTMTEEELLDEMKQLAVHGESQIISRVNLRNMCQDHNEDVRHFAARLKGKAALCNYVVKCRACDEDISYADEEVRDQLCTGLADPEIQKEVLARRQQNSSTEDLITFIEDREAGKRSQSSLTTNATISKISQYKRNKNKNLEDAGSEKSSFSSSSSSSLCSYCGGKGHGHTPTREVRKHLCPAYSTTCSNCNKPGHLTKMCRNKAPKVNAINSQAEFVGSIQIANIESQSKSLKMSHKEYNDINGWTATNKNKHPLITVTIDVSLDDYKIFNLKPPGKLLNTINRIAIADTGAMTVVAGMDLVRGLGLGEEDLIPVEIELSAANNSKLSILGGVFLSIGGRDRDGDPIYTRQICYIQKDDDNVYLSRSACQSLGMISKNFPTIGDCLNAVSVNKGMHNIYTPCSQNGKCSCPKREKPPTAPTTLPFPATVENREKLKNWILNRYASSTFNICENQTLPKMSGPPLKLNIDPSVVPTAVHTPIPIPVHWKEEVKAQLDRDCKLGVIEPVPWGEPTLWCSRMVIMPKANGSPRRTIDLQALNDASLRQTHHTPPPFHLAMSVPHNTKKTVLDAWNGYHSQEICEEDRHYTNFITPFGRYRYKCAPQGFLASGDAYTRKYDEIIGHINNKVKCIDDTLLWQDNIENAFFHTCAYLTLVGQNGITINPKKFQFAEDEAEFAGFKITPTNVQPSDKYLEAIQNFPTPTDITGMRSWFGLVNQSAYAFSMAEKMAPFRESLKPGTKFHWDEDLQQIFEKSKQEIIDAVKNGVRLFDQQKRTALITDWSRTGTGFSLMQKHCNCVSELPTCCKEGWKLVFAGSQFNNKAEAKYSPIEGECLAVVKALQKPTVRYFVHGCNDFIIATDHKPLIKLLGNRKLEDIDNPRLMSLKEKTLAFRFTMKYVPGAKNKVPDATSRFPTTTANDEHSEVENTTYITAISSLANIDRVEAITWEKIQEETLSDNSMLELLNAVQGGFLQKKNELPSHLQHYKKFAKALSTVDDVVLYKDRIIIPPRLRQDVLANLHSAHQGVSSMIARAEASVFWPGITQDIHKIRDNCFRCNRNAPSHPNMPPVPPILPEYPFQSICADYFTLEGVGYLVVVDRYSNWPSVQKAGKGDANSKKLIEEIKKHCETFGIPEELSSDGGPQFTSRETAEFMKNYGIQRRISSVQNPHSNCRAEIGVKTMKRLLADNTGPGGSLNTDKVLRALLQYRNTPDPDTGLSPAEIIFGRKIRDFTPVLPGHYKPSPEWRHTLQLREKVLSRRHVRNHEKWSEHTQRLPPLKVGDHVYIQNQLGNHPKKWDKSGIVVEVRQNHQYVVKTNGSGIPTLRNRKFLRKFTPYNIHLNIPLNNLETKLPPQPSELSNTESNLRSPGPADITPTLPQTEEKVQNNDDIRVGPTEASTPSKVEIEHREMPVLTPYGNTSPSPIQKVLPRTRLNFAEQPDHEEVRRRSSRVKKTVQPFQATW